MNNDEKLKEKKEWESLKNLVENFPEKERLLPKTLQKIREYQELSKEQDHRNTYDKR